MLGREYLLKNDLVDCLHKESLLFTICLSKLQIFVCRMLGLEAGQFAQSKTKPIATHGLIQWLLHLYNVHIVLTSRDEEPQEDELTILSSTVLVDRV